MFKKLVLLSLSVLLFFTLAQISFARSATPGPVDLSGEINGAPYRIVVPAVWNGTLLVYAHGYRDKADHPGEVDNRTADIAPNAALASALLAQGYALAGSAYKDNGWAVEEGIHDTKDLAVFFRGRVARPDRTIIWAFSMGTVIGFKSMEQFGGIFDGALCACAVGAGATSSWDGAGDLSLAYDTVFGMPSSWGTFGDVRDDIDFETEVQPKLFGEVSNPANFPGFEFIRLVTGTPGRGDRLYQTYTNGNGHCNFTGAQLITAVNSINNWVTTGTRPTQANFPAALNFLQNYTPPPMNQP